LLRLHLPLNDKV